MFECSQTIVILMPQFPNKRNKSKETKIKYNFVGVKESNVSQHRIASLTMYKLCKENI